MAAVAVLAPAGFNVSLDPNTGWIVELSVLCMLWTLPIRFDVNNSLGMLQNATPISTPFMFIGNLPITCLRLVFVYQIYKLYQSRTTRKRTLVVGVASELQVTILGILAVIMPVFSLMSRYFIPSPILFLAALVIFKIAPPPEVSTPWEHPEESESWWAQQSKNDARAVPSRCGNSSNQG